MVVGPRRVGPVHQMGSSLLVMAIAGAAVIPLCYGWLSDRFDAHKAYWLVIPCYLIIGWYAAYGYRIGMQPKEGVAK